MTEKNNIESDITKKLHKEITNVTVHKGKTENFYTIYFQRKKEKKSIILSHKELMTPKKFIERYLQVFIELLPITRDKWYEIFNTVIKQKITKEICVKRKED